MRFALLVCGLAFATALSAQIEARSIALGGAESGFADSVETLFTNPAGLGQMKDWSMQVSGGGWYQLSNGLNPLDDLPVVSHDQVGFYYYDANNQQVAFDPTPWLTQLNSFLAQEGINKTWADLDDLEKQQLLQNYLGWQESYRMHRFFGPWNVLPMSYLSFPHGAIAFGEDVRIVNTLPGDWQGPLTQYHLDLTRTAMVTAGLGWEFGPLALGMNWKVLKIDLFQTKDFPLDTAENPASKALVSALSQPGGDLSDTIQTQMGVGSLLTLGKVEISATLDNLLTTSFSDLARGLGIGVAFLDSGNNLRGTRDIRVNQIAAVFKELGDDVNRTFSLGIETGVVWRGAFGFLARGGLSLATPGLLTQIFSVDENRLSWTGGLEFQLGSLSFDFGMQVAQPLINYWFDPRRADYLLLHKEDRGAWVGGTLKLKI